MNSIITPPGSIFRLIIGLLLTAPWLHGLNNADIITLHKAGISADTLVVAINSADEKDFDVSALSLVGLKEAGVEESVIQAMLISAGKSVPVPEVPAEPEKEIEVTSALEKMLTTATLVDDEPEKVSKPEKIVPQQIVPEEAVKEEIVPEDVPEPVVEAVVKEPPQPVVSMPKIKTAPRPVSRPAPVYPKQLREQGKSGSVVVRFTVNTSGGVQDIEVVESDHELFTESAIQALSEWKFQPALEDGVPVDTVVKLPIPFNIRDKESEISRGPQIISNPAPVYPAQLRKKNVTGSVKVRFVVNTSGDVQDIEVLASDHELFTEEALNVLEEWKFSPALEKGQPIDARAQITIPFKVIGEDVN